MSEIKPLVFSEECVKEFSEAIREYNIVDGDPLTIGHALKELPKQVISHGRIYNVEHLNVNAVISEGTSAAAAATVSHQVKPIVRETGYGSMSSQLNITRCENEVTAWSYAGKPISHEDHTFSYGETLEQGLDAHFTLSALMPCASAQQSTEDTDMLFNYTINGGPAKYVKENIYPVDPDVIQDL